MKKVLFASTILASLGSVAHAENGVTIDGYGRFGAVYSEGRDGAGFVSFAPLSIPNANGNTEAYYQQNSTTFTTRLRINLNAKVETDSGATFGGLLRLQYDDGTSGNLDIQTAASNDNNVSGQISPALLYGEYMGFRVEVGNVNTALDSAPLFYNSELGLLDTSFGDSRSAFFAFSSGPYNIGRNGLSAFYSVGGFSGGVSYVDPNQIYTFDGKAQEYSIFAAYNAGAFTVSGAATINGAGIKSNDIYFIGAAYAINDAANVGLNYIDEGVNVQNGVQTSLGETVVLYGNYTMDAMTFKGYISWNNYGGSAGYEYTEYNVTYPTGNTVSDPYGDGNQNDYAFGVGLDYDLGGAVLKTGIQYGYDENVYFDAGVKFNF